MLQKIFFGPPGCGKSYRVRQEAEDELKIVGKNNPNMIETTFHPEYSYGDFVAKLLPQTPSPRECDSPAIEYVIHVGPFIKALARAYADPRQKVLLAIDEINRGNCAQIFGDIFQLLDRRGDGWSEYGVDLSRLTKNSLAQELKINGKTLEALEPDYRSEIGDKLRLPPNLSIIGTMNTSDESVYYMDTAFKRRWDFEYMPWRGTEDTPKWQENAEIEVEDAKHTWYEFLEKLNAFIAKEFEGRNVDDKQVGIWFLRAAPPKGIALLLKNLEKLKGRSDLEDWKKHFPNAMPFTHSKDEKRLRCESIKVDLKEKYGFAPDGLKFEIAPSELAARVISHIDFSAVITLASIQNKLMFFLWDNVFSRDRKPLEKLINPAKKLRTFGEFSSNENVVQFIKSVEKLADDGTIATPP